MDESASRESPAWRRLEPARWAIWAQPTPTVVFVLGVEAIAFSVCLALLLLAPQQQLLGVGLWVGHLGGDAPWPALLTGGLLVASGIAYIEVTHVIERTRRAITPDYAFDSIAVWTFAAALLLPPGLGMLVVFALYAHSWLRSWKAKTPLYRTVFSATSVALGVATADAALAILFRLVGASAVGNPGVSLGAVVVAGLAYAAANHILVTAVIVISDPEGSWKDVWGSWEDNELEAATIFLGALNAAAMTVHPALVALLPVPLAVLTRAALVRELRETLALDPKTGLLTADAWHTRAQHVLDADPRRPGATLGILMCDLDHFKQVNDTHGHLAGDIVLRKVAEALTAAVRPPDLVARFGGEEFLILLTIAESGHPRTAAEAATAVVRAAERIRASIAALEIELPTADGPLTIAPLTMSIGAIATSSGAAQTARIAELVGAADAAVYRAKDAGRNQVFMP